MSRLLERGTNVWLWSVDDDFCHEAIVEQQDLYGLTVQVYRDHAKGFLLEFWPWHRVSLLRLNEPVEEIVPEIVPEGALDHRGRP